MTENSKEVALDDLDKVILDILQVNGRISNADLARQTNLSPPAIHARIKRLEQQGFIRQYVALLDWESVGYDMMCFITVSIQVHQPEAVEHFREAVRQMPEVLECHHVTGEYDYLLKVAIRNRKDLERFVIGQLTPIGGIAHIHTSLVLNEVKSTTRLALE
jgi:Lrp/AsnC family leucine-responsive transcriptional regulator